MVVGGSGGGKKVSSIHTAGLLLSDPRDRRALHSPPFDSRWPSCMIRRGYGVIRVDLLLGSRKIVVRNLSRRSGGGSSGEAGCEISFQNIARTWVESLAYVRIATAMA